MTRRFDEGPTYAKRGLQIWLVLIGRAGSRQTITYGTLAEVLGFGGAGVLAGMLEYVLRYCRANGLPPLTSIVVNKETGLPGEGFGEQSAEAIGRAHESVFAYNWYQIMPPTVAELEEAVRAARKV